VEISVVIPWREQPSRIQAFKKLLDFYSSNFPEIKIIVSDSLGEEFHLAQARNLGAQKAIQSGSDIILFNDADFFGSPHGIKKAIRLALKNKEIVAPYNLYFIHNTVEETSLFFENLDYSLKIGNMLTAPKISKGEPWPKRLWPCSGLIVVPTEIFLSLGGFEEAITGWGPEDTFFHRAYFDKYGKIFGYVFGHGHSTFNNPEVRIERLENQRYKELSEFKDRPET
jgi:predicted glycosyltransferase involved in capsule biosynthesis